MTGHTPQKLPFFNAISCIIAVRSADFAYTRSIILSPIALFVNNFFRKYHKNFYIFSVNSQNFSFPVSLCQFASYRSVYLPRRDGPPFGNCHVLRVVVGDDPCKLKINKQE